MQRVENDPCDIEEFLAGKGVKHALDASLLLEDKALENTYLWSEPLLIASAMEVLRDLGHQDDYERLGLHTNWEELLFEATASGDELAASVCLDFIP